MGTTVFWFSGTGNSLHVAKLIADQLPAARLWPIAAGVDNVGEVGEQIILVCPVYAWGIPAIVERFIRDMPVTGVEKASAVLTHGGVPGGAGAVARSRLRKRGLHRVKVYSVRMVDNYPPFGGPPTEEEKRQKLLVQGENELSGVISAIVAGRAGKNALGNRFFRAIGTLLHPLFRMSLKKADRKFTSTEACTGCGTCVQVCPVDDIRLESGRPLWCGHCEQCFACFHWCPEKAILYGARTARQVRYHHPGVELKEMIVGESGC